MVYLGLFLLPAGLPLRLLVFSVPSSNLTLVGGLPLGLDVSSALGSILTLVSLDRLRSSLTVVGSLLTRVLDVGFAKVLAAVYLGRVVGSLLTLFFSLLTLEPFDVRDRLASDLGLTLMGSLLVSLLTLLISFLTLDPFDVRERLAADLGRLSLSALTLSAVHEERDRLVSD